MHVKTFGAVCAIAILPGFVLASPGHGTDVGFGEAGRPGNVNRTIEVAMKEMKFDPKTIVVEPGETVRFVVTNTGQFIHEFNIGTDSTWDGHRAEMNAMMRKGMITAREIRHARMEEAGMMHDDPNSVLLAPNQTAEVIWTFPEEGEVGFACNVPGHREAGMKGTFSLLREATMN
ncbi:putative cupredoxin-like copper-binding protein [Maritimibacter alkaliphilus HTCC2654]|uniref:Uncharacterized copper-binding protein n=1 Tax=Maritimibacter alkaliphilus HTCC2654 TaxID=314271 RepID=A3VEH5_9RHOB|nr:plastocyanin/azurin family copper-binding protein [Maritimibacter alkaliphilus]EAQ13313.1 uncharacterized copper-binding protein [Rhodobacterales bacterium HTCC2654] [Maritimibacter alkaliphilus HTCC2654]TYP85267.1 putative cupredoxin-like copper-binding protein [Maritimibacter alkaliphilus HTCC2654]